MNEGAVITLRARKDKKWVLEQIEKIAKEKQRSISYIVMEMLEKQLNGKPVKNKK